LAVNVAVGSWDDYWYNKNNFFLYNNLKTGQFELIGYDYDNTFGIGWDSNDWGVRDIYCWGSGDRPLTDRILANQQFKNLYTYIIRTFVTEYFNETSTFPRIDSLKAMISSAAADDYYRTLDYGYTVADFNNSYTTALGAHVKYGLKPYINSRRASILNQAEMINVAPFFVSLPIISFNSSGQATISVDIFDEKRPVEVFLHYQAGVQFVDVNLENISERSDGPFTIYRYCTTLPYRQAGEELRFYFSAADDASQTGKFPFAAPDNLLSLTFPDTLPRLFINEILASNSTTNTDEFGEYDDWMEIYCDSGSIDLAGFFLTDNFSQPDKWAFPDTVISAGPHLLIWADDQAEQGAWHASFKLDKSGEFLAIFRKTDTTFVLIDSLTFGLQTANISFGRIPDGGDNRSFMPPSPGSANSLNAIWKNSSLPTDFTVYQNYPNPFNGQTKIRYYLPQSAVVQIAVLDLIGRIVLDFTPQNQSAGKHIFALSLEEIGSGIYFVRVNAGKEQRLLKCVLVK
ncbi:MAG: CotH kinase family protein, partial [Candidatus Neomarinimicrobiota bacterium]